MTTFEKKWMSLMKKRSLILNSFLIIFFFINFSSNSAERIKSIAGKAKVIDGDTIKILGQNIRLRGIDAPEKKQLCVKKSKTYGCGIESKKALKNYIGRELIRCEYFARDRYGRILGTCNLLDSTKSSLNSFMVYTGNAVAYLRYSKEYIDEEKWAKEKKLGMWQGKFERPEEWRKKYK